MKRDKLLRHVTYCCTTASRRNNTFALTICKDREEPVAQTIRFLTCSPAVKNYFNLSERRSCICSPLFGSKPGRGCEGGGLEVDDS